MILAFRKAPVVRREVNVTGHARERVDASAVANVEKLLELARLPDETVLMPDDNGIDVASINVGEHPSVLRPRLAAVGAHVVVDVLLDDGPVSSVRESFTVG